MKCNKNLCPLCKSHHDNTHDITNYDFRNSICSKKNNEFIKYCEGCKLDLCSSCEKEHKHQEQEFYFSTFSNNYQEIRFKMNQLKDAINKMNENIKESIKKLGKIVDNMEILYNIYNQILLDIEENKVKNFCQNSNLKLIKFIIDEELNNIKSKFKYGCNFDQMFYIYNDMEEENLLIEMNYTLN